VARPARGLGRGLAALIDPTAAEPRLFELDVDRIVPNARQPRRRFDEGALADLARSISADGVVQPVVVRDRGDGSYELIAGERRWRAAQAAGLHTIPAVIRAADERSALRLALVENVVREDLGAIEVARGYAMLADEFGLGTAEIAASIGKSRAAVANTLRLLELPDDVIALIEDGVLSEGHGRAILQADGNDARRAIARRAVTEGLSVRQAEALSRSASRSRRRATRGPAWIEDAAAGEAVDAAYRAFGLPARIVAAGGGARLELCIASAADLQRLAGLLAAAAAAGERVYSGPAGD
jgi:ParB family chromosome partitioning protein